MEEGNTNDKEMMMHYELLTIFQLISKNTLQWYKEGKEVIMFVDCNQSYR